MTYRLTSNSIKLYDVETGKVAGNFWLGDWMYIHDKRGCVGDRLSYFGVSEYKDGQIVEKYILDSYHFIPGECWWSNSYGHVHTKKNDKTYWLFYIHTQNKFYINSNENYCVDEKVFLEKN